MPQETPEYWGISEVGNQTPIECIALRFSSSTAVAFYADGHGSSGFLGYLLFDSGKGRLTDIVYEKFFISEDKKSAIVTDIQNPDVGFMIDETGKTVKYGVPVGRLTEDNLVIKSWDRAAQAYSYYKTDGSSIEPKEAAAIHAGASPFQLSPYEQSPNEYVYVDADGKSSPAFQPFYYATRFCSECYAYAITQDGHEQIIGADGKVIISDVTDYYWYESDPLEFVSGRLPFSVSIDGKTLAGMSNYLCADGSTLYPNYPLLSADAFYYGRARVSIMLPDYSSVTAYISPDGEIVWAEEGADATMLQQLLDSGSCPRPYDITPEEATEILAGDWYCTGGGEHLSYNKELPNDFSVHSFATDDREWRVEELKPEDDFWNGTLALVEEYTDENGEKCESRIGALAVFDHQFVFWQSLRLKDQNIACLYTLILSSPSFGSPS